MPVEEILKVLAGLSDTDDIPQDVADAIIGLSDEDYDKVFAAIPENEKVEVTDVNGDGDKDTVTVDKDNDGTVDEATVAADSKEEANDALKEVAKKAEPKTEKPSLEEKNPFNNYHKKDGADIKPEVTSDMKNKPPKDFGKEIPEEMDFIADTAKAMREYEKEFGVKPTAGLQPMNRNIVSALNGLIL